MAEMHQVGFHTIVDPIPATLKRLSQLWMNYRELNYSHPRKASHAYEMWQECLRLAQPLINQRWLESWSDRKGEHIPMIDNRDIMDMLTEFRDGGNWSGLTWEMIREQLCRQLQQRGYYVPGFGRKIGVDEETEESLYYCDRCQKSLGKSYYCGNCGNYEST